MPRRRIPALPAKGLRAWVSGTVLALLALAPLSAGAQGEGKIDLRPIDDRSLKAEIGKRRGKIVLVSLWSRSCPPCIEAYPELVEMGKKYGPQGLEILSINVIDDAKTRQSWTIPFLEKQNPTFATFYENASDDEAFIRALDAKWYGGLPAEFLFNRQGKRIVSMTEDVDMSKLEGLVRRHLEGKGDEPTDSTVAQLREFIEQKGGVLLWFPSTRTVQAVMGSRTVVLKIGDRTAQVNAKSVRMDKPARVVSGRTVVPRSFLKAAFQAG